jgi:regulator of sigma E protease
MTGENPGEEPIVDDPGAFMAHPRWQRMLIGVAGPFFNFVLAFVLMVWYFGWINEVPDIKTTRIEWVSPGSVADQAGLKTDDIIRSFNNVANPDVAAFDDLINDDDNQTVPVTVERSGKLVDTSLHIPADSKTSDTDLSQAGIFVQVEHSPIGIERISANSPAEHAGLRPGDSIVAVDGHAFHTVVPLLDYMQTGQGKPITLTVARKGVTLPPIVVYPYAQDSKYRLGFVSATPDDLPIRYKPMTFSKAVASSRDFCARNSVMIVSVLRKLFTHQESVTNLSGPVGIAVAAGDAAKTKDWGSKFGLAASISLNLGILNLLPFPILDGGLILLLLIESTIRRDISMIVKERIYQAAFVVLVALFAFITFNDVVTKLSIFSHLKP